MISATPTLLYIDDDEGLAHLVHRGLTQHGYKVVHARSGTEGIERIVQGGIDVVALDQYMPGLDGLETLERILAVADAPPVVFVTASQDSTIAVTALKAGAADYIVKDALTPRYGYDVPELIEKAGLTEQYEECFQLSLQLHSALQKAGYTLEAQYATLLGHKMRWKVSYNAREAFHLHELRTSPQGHSGYRKLVQQMHEKVAEVHPLLAEAMIFVNKGEDEKLTRLAAERYTQYKLAQLDKKA